MVDKGSYQFQGEHTIENYKGYINIIRITLEISGY